MSTVAIEASDYLVDVDGAWLHELREELLIPMADKGYDHPVMQQIRAGTFPKEKLIQLLSDLCWVITGFPEYVAALASRTPKNDHKAKAAMLENAYIERDHPFMLAHAINKLGGDGDAVINGPDWGYKPNDFIVNLRMVLEAYCFHRPWIEGMAAAAVGIETISPKIFGEMGKAVVAHYGLDEADAEWFTIHGGEVEMEHGNDGLRMLDAYVDEDDAETQQACIAAIRIVCKGVAQDLFDTYQ